jgi:hypothetical protein
VPGSVDEWSDQHWDRSFARHSAQVDTVKLLVTFALGIAATLVATALQVGPASGLDLAASILLGAAFLLALAAIVLDRLKWPSRRKALEKQTDEGWTDGELLVYLRLLMRDTEDENQTVVARVRKAAEYQVLLSGVAAALAVVSLFQ